MSERMFVVPKEWVSKERRRKPFGMLGSDGSSLWGQVNLGIGQPRETTQSGQRQSSLWFWGSTCWALGFCLTPSWGFRRLDSGSSDDWFAYLLLHESVVQREREEQRGEKDEKGRCEKDWKEGNKLISSSLIPSLRNSKNGWEESWDSSKSLSSGGSRAEIRSDYW